MAYKVELPADRGADRRRWQALPERPELRRGARPDDGGDPSGDGV